MFARLFSQSGLSLERLRALVEVGASGSIVKAAGSDLGRQSQYSRQIKELESFFQCSLVERHGKGIRLTASGRELARICRFFLLGLSNFQLGCLAEGQTYRIGSPPTFAARLLLPFLANPRQVDSGIRFSVEQVSEDEIERRLHDLRLDFGIVVRPVLSRPLRTRHLGFWNLSLLSPRRFARSPKQAAQALKERCLPLAWPEGELPRATFKILERYEPMLSCGSFLEALTALEGQGVATVLPKFLIPETAIHNLVTVPWKLSGNRRLSYHLAWNPRLLRLNPHAARRRDALTEGLSQALTRIPH